MRTFHRLLLFCFLGCLFLSFHTPRTGVVSICSWNIRDFGKSKSDSAIHFIAGTIRHFDIVLIQEVVAGPGGAEGIARLADVLNRSGAKWEYTVSDPTYGESYKTERYAFLWKTAAVKRRGNSWLESTYKEEIDREPYYTTFLKNGREFTLANFHAITKTKQPEREVKYFKLLPALYPELNLIFCGDFNLPQSHTVFNPLKSMGYSPILTGQKTTLKKNCMADDCLASEFDNAFLKRSGQTLDSAGIIPFHTRFNSVQDAAHISDHVPIFFQLSFQ